MFEEWAERGHQFLTRRQIFLQPHPRTWPAVQIPAVMFQVGIWRGPPRFIFVVLAVVIFHFMLRLITIL